MTPKPINKNAYVGGLLGAIQRAGYELVSCNGDALVGTPRTRRQTAKAAVVHADSGLICVFDQHLKLYATVSFVNGKFHSCTPLEELVEIINKYHQ